MLSPVVEVALEPAPLGIAGLDDASPRRAQVLQLGEHLGLEALVLDGEPCGRADLARELAAVEKRGVVDDDRDRLAIPRDLRYRSPGRGRRRIRRSPLSVHEAA